MRIIKKIPYYIVVISLILYILLMALNPASMMDLVGFRTMIVLSNSMEPVINENDLIISRKVNQDELEIGDIITFSVYLPQVDKEVYVTHYIGDIQTNEEMTIYKTKGYNLPEGTYDGWVDKDDNHIDITFDDIEGVYFFKIPYIGYIQSILNDKIILGLILFNVGIIYITGKVLKKIRTKRENIENI